MSEMAAPEADDEWYGASNELLVDRYLRAKLEGTLGDLARAAYFRDADVCSAQPWELVGAHTKPARAQLRDAGDGKQWYFFSPARFVGTKQKKRRARTIDGTGDKESWHAEGSSKPVEGSACGGYITKLSYHVKIGPKIVEKPGWIMTEYSFKDIREGDTVLCKVYKSPRGPGRSADSSSSAKSGCKRKAADDLEGAAPRTRPRQSSKEEEDVMLFAGDIERDLMSVEEVPEFGETQKVLEIQPQPQPQIVPASFAAVDMLEEMPNWSMPLVDHNEDFEAFDEGDWGSLFDNIDQQDATIQTTHGLLTDGGVIAALATGLTVDDLLSNDQSCSHPAGGAPDVPCT